MANIDLNNLYKQSKQVQLGAAAGVVALVMLVAYFGIFKGQWENITALKEEEENTLKPDYEDKAQQAASLPILKDELAQIRTAFEVLLKQLPTDAEIPNLIQELHQAGAKNNMRMNSVKPLAPINDENVQQLPYEISITGSYDKIAQFTRDVGRLSRIVTLDTINLTPVTQGNTPSGESNGMLTLQARANTYKALEAAPASAPASSPESAQ